MRRRRSSPARRDQHPGGRQTAASEGSGTRTSPRSTNSSATCARVPVFSAHSESINVQTIEPLSAERCRELFADAPGLAV
ncbi:MAG: Asd/ArgC dimerization domain-containing protein, partial [Solirubrobacterales bacterium]